MHDLKVVNGLPSTKSESTARTGKNLEKTRVGRAQSAEVASQQSGGEKTEALRSSNPEWAWGFGNSLPSLSSNLCGAETLGEKSLLLFYDQVKTFPHASEDRKPQNTCLAPGPLELHPLVLRRKQAVLGI